MKQIRQRLTYANVMSSIAVFMVLGGATAFAATKIGANEIKANSIKTGKIVKEAVTEGKIKNGAISTNKLANVAVTSDKLADNAVTTAKIADKAVTSAKINLATLGTVPDATKLAGRSASEYLRSSVQRVVVSSAITSAVGQFREAIATCPAGQQAISGGGMWTFPDGSPTGFNVLQGSRPVPSTGGTGIATGWQATGISDNATGRVIQAYAICVPQ